MTTLVKILLIKNQVKRNTFKRDNWKYYRDAWNLDFTPAEGIALFYSCGRLFSYINTYTASIRKGSKLYKWVLKQRSFAGRTGTLYLIPPYM